MLHLAMLGDLIVWEMRSEVSSFMSEVDELKTEENASNFSIQNFSNVAEILKSITDR